MNKFFNFKKTDKLYKQEGAVGMYQIIIPYLSTTNGILNYLPYPWGESFAYAKDNYFKATYFEENLKKVAEAFFEKSKNGFPEEWINEWYEIDKRLTSESKKIAYSNLELLSLKELYALYENIFSIGQEMWAISIFIDTLDPGFDSIEIERIVQSLKIQEKDKHTLLIPEEPSYLNKWENILCEYKEGKTSFENIKDNFFWVGTNYSDFEEVTEEFVKKEEKKAHFIEYDSKINEKKKIIEKYNLPKNPLEVFCILGVWRDERKRLNYTNLYGLVRILREVSKRHKISTQAINGLLHYQVKDFFDGNINEDQLKDQLTNGMFLHVTKEGEFKYSFGANTLLKWKEVEDQIHGEIGNEIKGMIASKGVATGFVRIISDANSIDAQKMKEGDILVTSMTRPEFISLMKLASAIVTDEGGISCHAAIVSRELKKPCIIGTKNATKILKDGDMVEVDGNNGTVKIINQTDAK